MERSSSMKLISDRLKNGEKPIGTFLNLGSQTAAECVAIAGMDYFIVDLEHSPFGLAEAADCIRMAKLKGISPLVRIPEISRANILKHLDVGAEGIIIPGLKTREETMQIPFFFLPDQSFFSCLWCRYGVLLMQNPCMPCGICRAEG